jgi:hypothetical protein
MTKRKIKKKSKKKNINLTTLNDNNSHKINNDIFIKDIIEDIINIIEKKSNNIQINIKKSSEKYIHNDINNTYNNIKNTNNTNIVEKNKKNIFNNIFEELDIVSNPIHGKYGQEKQIDQVIYNNYIINNYIDEKWNSFLTFFQLKN